MKQQRKPWPYRWSWHCPICGACSEIPMQRSRSQKNGKEHIMHKHGVIQEPTMEKVKNYAAEY